MKKTLIYISILTSCLSGFAQAEFAPIGAEWYYNYREQIQSPATGYYLLKSIKDTIINSKECKVLSRTYVNSKGISSKDGQSVVYKDTKENKIYRYLYGNFYLLYDFTKVAGDTIVIKEPSSSTSYSSIIIVVDSVGFETLPNNIQLKSLYVSQVQGKTFDFSGKIIEGIGNLGFFFPFNQMDCDGGCPFPLRCYNDARLNFVSHEPNSLQVSCDFVYTSTYITKPTDVNVYPNPFNNSFTIKTVNQGERFLSIDIFNSLGKRILHEVHPFSISQEINLRGYPSGLYYLKIKTMDKTIRVKLIKTNFL